MIGDLWPFIYVIRRNSSYYKSYILCTNPTVEAPEVTQTATFKLHIITYVSHDIFSQAELMVSWIPTAFFLQNHDCSCGDVMCYSRGLLAPCVNVVSGRLLEIWNPYCKWFTGGSCISTGWSVTHKPRNGAQCMHCMVVTSLMAVHSTCIHLTQKQVTCDINYLLPHCQSVHKYPLTVPVTLTVTDLTLKELWPGHFHFWESLEWQPWTFV